MPIIAASGLGHAPTARSLWYAELTAHVAGQSSPARRSCAVFRRVRISPIINHIWIGERMARRPARESHSTLLLTWATRP